MREESEGVSLGDVWRVVVGKIWWLILFSAIAAIIVPALLYFVVRRDTVEYALTFEVDYPDLGSKRYPDGTAFDYRDMISAETLRAAKATDEDYADLDVSRLLEADDISVEPVTGDEKNPVAEGTYRLGIKGKYFRSAETASKYLRAVANQVIERVNTAVKRFNNAFYLETYDSVLTYEEQIDMLSAEKDYLVSQYESLIGIYGENYEVAMQNEEAGKTLRSYFAEVNTTLANLTLRVLRTDLENGGYRLREDDKLIQSIIDDLQKEKQENVALIEDLEQETKKLQTLYAGDASYIPQFDAFHSRIAELIARNAAIDTETEIRTRSLQTTPSAEYDSKKQAFVDRLDREYYLLIQYADIYHAVAEKLYQEESRVRFFSTKPEGVGGTSIALAAVASFAVVFLAGAVVVYVAHAFRKRPEADGGEAEGAPAQGGKLE